MQMCAPLNVLIFLWDLLVNMSSLINYPEEREKINTNMFSLDGSCKVHISCGLHNMVNAGNLLCVSTVFIHVLLLQLSANVTEPSLEPTGKKHQVSSFSSAAEPRESIMKMFFRQSKYRH